MKKKIGFYFDAQKSGVWDWESFLRGDIGMSGTDGQLLLLVNDLSFIYTVYFFTNADHRNCKNFDTVQVLNVEDAAEKAKALNVDLLVFNNKDDDNTINGINKLESLKMPFILWDQNGPSAPFETLLSRSKFLKRIVAVSKTQTNWHRHRKYFPKMTYIYNGKDYPDCGQTPANVDKDIHIGYVGAVSESKGFHWVAMAWPKIRKRFPRATLTVIGSIKTHDRTRNTGDFGIAEVEFEEKYIKRYLGKDIDEITKNGIILTGHIAPNEMSSHMYQFHLGVVNPNVNGSNETFCVSAIDFQGHCVPVVGANSGGLKETISNKRTGLLINKSDKLAETVIQLFVNRDRLAYFKNNCATWVKKFSREKTVAEWEQLINDVLNGVENKLLGIDLNEVSVKLIAKEVIRISNRFK